jgi:hypothetical protein
LPRGRLLSTAFLSLLAVRRSAVFHPKLMGAAIGGLADLTGLSVLAMNCSKVTVRNPRLVAAGGPKKAWQRYDSARNHLSKALRYQTLCLFYRRVWLKRAVGMRITLDEQR